MSSTSHQHVGKWLTDHSPLCWGQLSHNSLVPHPQTVYPSCQGFVSREISTLDIFGNANKSSERPLKTQPNQSQQKNKSSITSRKVLVNKSWLPRLKNKTKKKTHHELTLQSSMGDLLLYSQLCYFSLLHLFFSGSKKQVKSDNKVCVQKVICRKLMINECQGVSQSIKHSLVWQGESCWHNWEKRKLKRFLLWLIPESILI